MSEDPNRIVDDMDGFRTVMPPELNTLTIECDEIKLQSDKIELTLGSELSVPMPKTIKFIIKDKEYEYTRWSG